MPIPNITKAIAAGAAGAAKSTPIGGFVQSAIESVTGTKAKRRRRRAPRVLTQAQKNELLWVSSTLGKTAAANRLAQMGR